MRADKWDRAILKVLERNVRPEVKALVPELINWGYTVEHESGSHCPPDPSDTIRILSDDYRMNHREFPTLTCVEEEFLERTIKDTWDLF